MRPAVPLVKIAVPPVLPSFQPRARLLSALDATSAHETVLVCAPAGYGKTLLLADWAARRPECIAWVSLDDDDNDDRRFWSAVLAALRACPMAPTELCALAVPPTPSRDPDFLASTLNVVGAATGPVHLVLDDVHRLSAPDPLHGLTALVRDRPAALRLVLSGRADPPLPLARLRLDGSLREIRAAELRFSATEAEQLLAAARLRIRPEQVHELVEHTEGWPAGLRMAELALRETPDAQRFVPDLLASTRAVAEYLVSEVLSCLPAGTRCLLRAVSICDQLSPSLATALSGRADAGQVLASLEQETALVTSTGDARARYRVQPLLRSYLRTGLQRQRPDLLVQLHGRAADWSADHGDAASALLHAAATGDADRIARMLHARAVALITEGRHRTVRAALNALGASRVAADPWLALVGALLATESASLGTAGDLLRTASTAWPAEPEPGLLALWKLVRSRQAVLSSGPTALADELTSDAAAASERDLELVPMAAVSRGVALFVVHRCDEARELAEAALRQARQHHQDYVCALGLVLLALIDADGGDYAAMTAAAEAADGELDDPGWRGTIGGACSLVVQAYGALLRARPQACLDLLAGAVRDGDEREIAGELSVMRTALRGAALVDLGHGGGASVLREARSAVPPTAAQLGAVVALLEHGAASHLGGAEAGRAVAAWAQEHLGPTGEVSLLRARHQAGLGRYDRAREALAPVLDGSQPVLLPWTLIEVRVQACRLALSAGRRTQARRELHRAIALSHRMSVIRPLVTSPPQVIALLAEHVGSFGEHEGTAADALSARSGLGDATHRPALTDRERDVLALLPTQRSLGEIAVDLTVSPNTVKTHVRALYGKLGVSTRRDAVAWARRRGILSPGGR